MRTIIKIIGVESRHTIKGNEGYWRTHALLDDGTEAVGFGKDFNKGDEVEVFYHFGQIKMRKGKHGSGDTRTTQG